MYDVCISFHFKSPLYVFRPKASHSPYKSSLYKPSAFSHLNPRLIAHLAAFLVRPVEHIAMSFIHLTRAHGLVPRAAVRAHPLQRFKAPTLCCELAHFFIANQCFITHRFSNRTRAHRATVFPQPVENFSIFILQHLFACFLIPRASVCVQPLQPFQVVLRAQHRDPESVRSP